MLYDGRNHLRSIDLHRRTAAEATRLLGRELHAARVRGEARVLVITGRGYGNARQEPLLRAKVEDWLRGDEAERLGVSAFRRVHRDGALEVELRVPGRRSPPSGESDREPNDENR